MAMASAWSSSAPPCRARRCASSVAIGGIIAGGFAGGPVSTPQIERGKLRTPRGQRGGAPGTSIVELDSNAATITAADDDEEEVWPIIGNLVAILVAAGIRNLDDYTGWFRPLQEFINTFGIVTLTLFLVMALMTLKLREFAGLVLPLPAILLVQVVIAVIVATSLVHRVMARRRARSWSHRSSARSLSTSRMR